MFHDLFVRARSGRSLVGTAVLALGAGLLVPVGPPAVAAGSSAQTSVRSSVAWTPCGDGFDCATVSVPLDYDHPRGAQVSLAVNRLPAADPTRRIGSLLVNPGGPGGSGVDFVRAVAPFLPARLRARFDIVGLDPRGVMGSTPLRCFPTFDEALGTLPPFAFPVTRREEDVQRAADLGLAIACAHRGGRILGHMSTADVARDLNVLRHRMGDRRLSFLGFSYGSVLGQTYANLFPRRVRAIVIERVLDPIAWTTGRGRRGRSVPLTTRLRSDQGAQATLGEFFTLCDRAGSGCAFSGDSRRRYATLAARLRREPIVIQDPSGTYPFTYADLVGTTLGALYAPEYWPELGEFLAAVEDAAAARAGRALSALRAALGVTATAEQEDYPNVVEAFPGVACSDSVNPRSFAAWRQAADRSERRHGYFGRIWTWASSSCLPWPDRAGQDRYLGPWRARTSSPVLVVGNYFDPATRYQGAVTAARLLPRSRLLSYAGWGHTIFGLGNACIDRKVTTYLVSTRVPAAGTVCRPDGSPFAVPGTSTRARAATRAVTSVLLPESVRRALTGGR